jgi:hypothetical protein
MQIRVRQPLRHNHQVVRTDITSATSDVISSALSAAACTRAATRAVQVAYA